MLASKLMVHHMLSVGQTCHDKKLQQQSRVQKAHVEMDWGWGLWGSTGLKKRIKC